MKPPRSSRALAAALGCAVIVAVSCRREPAVPADDQASIRERLSGKDAMKVVEEAARARFTPPADGRLNEEQVRMYLEVREREEKIRQASGNAGAEVSAAGLRAAQELGRNPREYQWIGERVREARTAGESGDLDRKIVDSRRKILRSLEEHRRTLADPAKQAAVDRQIAEVRGLLKGAAPEIPPAVRHNSELLARLTHLEKKP